MKALSIKQPCAWLICAGYKDVENRSWRIGRNPRHGPYSSYDTANFTIELPMRIYVHASQSKSEMTKEVISRIRPLIPRPEDRGAVAASLLTDIFYGGIIGEVDIVECKYRFPDKSADFYSPWHATGQYGFYLVNAELYAEPVPCRGQLGFFTPNLHEGFIPDKGGSQ